MNRPSDAHISVSDVEAALEEEGKRARALGERLVNLRPGDWVRVAGRSWGRGLLISVSGDYGTVEFPRDGEAAFYTYPLRRLVRATHPAEDMGLCRYCLEPAPCGRSHEAMRS